MRVIPGKIAGGSLCVGCTSNIHSFGWFMIGKVQELSGRGDEQEVSEGEPEPSPLQEKTPEEEDTSNDLSSSFIAVVSYLCPVCSMI